jgi:hypothetical protein
MFNAPSKETQSPQTMASEKHPDKSLIKLFGQLRNALIDPATSQKVMDGIAGLAVGSIPRLGEHLGQIAQDPDMRQRILESTSHLTGYQGPSLHDQIRQLESRLNGSVQPPMGQQPMVQPPMSETTPQPMAQDFNKPTSTTPPMGMYGY